MKNWKLDRIISVATLVTSVIALFLVLKKPAPVAQPQPAAAAAVNARLQEKVQQLDQPKEAGKPPAEVRINSDGGERGDRPSCGADSDGSRFTDNIGPGLS